MNQLTKNIISMGGERGRAWLKSLPALVDLCADRWQLANLVPVPNLSYNYVLTGNRTSDGTNIVLKLGFCKDQLAREAAALRIYNGNGCVTLVDADIDTGALLLEQISPGTSLKKLFPDNDPLAVAHAVSVMQKLHAQPIPEAATLPTIKDWLKALDTVQGGFIDAKILDRAKRLAADLLQSQDHFVLLHGDLHHENILSSYDSGWIAIDPSGVLGPPAFEIGAFITNPIPELLQHPDPAKVIFKRLDLFADLMHIDRHILQNWSYVQAVLAACWSVEDGTSIEYFLTCARLIDR